MKPWEHLAQATAEDGTELILRRRGHEYLILAGGHDLMSSEDDDSARALAEIGCSDYKQAQQPRRVLVGGLGMGYSLRAALDACGPAAEVTVAEWHPVVVDWNRAWLGELAKKPLDDPRTRLEVDDVRRVIAQAAEGGREQKYDAILLDVDNGPDALAHDSNDALYGHRGLTQIQRALRPDGRLAVWSFSDDPAFVRRMGKAGFDARAERVAASRSGRGRTHVIFFGRRAQSARPRSATKSGKGPGKRAGGRSSQGR